MMGLGRLHITGNCTKPRTSAYYQLCYSIHQALLLALPGCDLYLVDNIIII